ncbi:hypothetical protein J6590_072220 [Homalodisca vitripennis]|nr:hypothetical protein J6590_072220 [Homalodisca vitripennis]
MEASFPTEQENPGIECVCDHPCCFSQKMYIESLKNNIVEMGHVRLAQQNIRLEPHSWVKSETGGDGLLEATSTRIIYQSVLLLTTRVRHKICGHILVGHTTHGLERPCRAASGDEEVAVAVALQERGERGPGYIPGSSRFCFLCGTERRENHTCIVLLTNAAACREIFPQSGTDITPLQNVVSSK